MRLERKLGAKKMPLLALALGALALFQAFPGTAGGSHVRPKGASPISDSLVPAHRECVAPNRTHAPALTLPSCNPAVPTSQFLQVGTPDNNGAQANLIGRVQITAQPSDVAVALSVTDVRCYPGNSTPACNLLGGANSTLAGGQDYGGQLELVIGFRLTDHYNDPTTGFTRAGTSKLVQLRVPVQCQTTATPNNIGNPCSVNTTVNAVWGTGAVVANRRMDFEIPQTEPGGGIQVFDGGSTNVAGSSDAGLFLEPGVFVP